MIDVDRHQVVVCVGTNYQREKYLSQAFDLLYECFGEFSFSSVYESQSVDHPAEESNKSYYNVVLCLCTEKTLSEVQKIVHDIELACDRDRTKTFVSMDIDILLYDDMSGVIDDLSLPHSDINVCAHVLRPLSELLPNVLHPVAEKSFSLLWQEFYESNDNVSIIKPVDFVWREQVISVSPSCLIM